VRESADPEEVAEVFVVRMVGEERWRRFASGVRAARRAEGVALVGEITSLQVAAPWDPREIRVPVVAGRGSEARPHHARGMEEVARWIGGARLVTLPGCGHLAHVAAPDQFTDDLVRPLLLTAFGAATRPAEDQGR
jgi:pimeloyl-ACP methyl ester carboxylesterase